MIKQDEIPHWEYLCKTFEGNLTPKEAWGSIYWQGFPFGLPYTIFHCHLNFCVELWGEAAGFDDILKIQSKAMQKFPLQTGMKAEKLA